MMSEVLSARPSRGSGQPGPLFSRPETRILRFCGQPEVFGPNKERATEMQTPLRKDQETPLRGVRTNIVQSIRAFRVQDLQDAAASLGQHFLYANLAHAQSKQDVLDLIAAQFTFPSHFGKNFDALYDCMTDPAMPQISGATERFRSAVSILFCSPFCNHQPSRTGERG